MKTSPVARLGLLALALPLASCGSSAVPTSLVSLTADDKVEKYDLYVRDEATREILLHTRWTDATLAGTRDITTTPLKIGLTFPKNGSYGLVLIGVAGATEGDKPAPGAVQFFWAKLLDVNGSSAIDARLIKVPDGDDADRDLFPDAIAWVQNVAPRAKDIPPALLDCDDKMDFPMKKVVAAEVNPFAVEKCGDSIDESCNGDGDEPCVDADNDGDPDRTDCAPMDPTIHHPTLDDPFPEAPNCCGYSLGKTGPDATKSFATDTKLCHAATCDDTIDQDCDGKPTVCVRDQDCDTFAAAPKQDNGCGAMAGMPPGNTDCDDCDPTINPLAAELCDAKDNNCDGKIDEVCVDCDLDGDGYQRMDAKNNCPDAMNKLPIDCNDEDSGVFPGSTMFSGSTLIPRLVGQNCNGSEGGSVVCALRGACLAKKPDNTAQDADCDGTPHKACPAMNDADGDGFPTPADCNDMDPHIFPGAPDLCGDGKAQNCSQDTPCNDKDNDKYNADEDCDDNDPNVHPWAKELCNGKDDDCDGLKDEGNPDAMGNAMVTNSQVTHCTDSNVGTCAAPQGDCVCSASSIENKHFDFVNRAACPGENMAIDTGAMKSAFAARCYFAAQPSPQLCTGNAMTQKDDDCDGRLDAPEGMNANGTPIPIVGQQCWPNAVGQCAPAKGGKVSGCKIAPVNMSSNCFLPFGVNPWWVCDNTAICPVAEKCNGFDDDCNTMIPVNERDVDGDRYMACGSPFNQYTSGQPCEMQLANGLMGCGDCFDSVGTTPGIGGAPINNNTLHPGSPDPCDSIDNDCDPGSADGKADCPGPKPANICCGTNGCKNPATDVNNCNGCGIVCVEANATPQCSNSACDVQSCNAGFANCNNMPVDGCEINLKVDANNCNACGTICSNSNMQTRTCGNGVCNGLCNANFADCDGNKLSNGCEISLLVDANNCNSCGTACSNNNMQSRTCGGGVCNGACNAGFADCNNNKLADGCEISLLTDPNNCNACGTNCSNNNMQSRTCGGGVCNGMCNAGFADCNNNKLGDGCEINLLVDANNCNGCGTVCSNSNMQTRTCFGGSCNGLCNAGFADCNVNKQSDGCEINTTNDPNHCGACPNVCSNNNMASRTCGASACNGGCNANFADCNLNKLTDGCEINLLTDATHCGGCANNCSANNIAAPTCGAGICNGACNGGFADCNGNKLGDGCEINLQTNPDNCNVCGTICSNNGMSSRTCGGGVCNGACAANRADCNLNKQSDGCEINTSNDVLNCNGCGIVCSTNNIARACSGSSCSAGVCTVGFGDCDANKQSNGCETNITNDANNCGACAAICSNNNMASRTCGASLCNGSCNVGFADCNNNKLPDGCEIDTTNNVLNCGGCGVICSTNNITRSCMASSCNAGSCNLGFADCNTNKQSDGCEINTTNNVLNCGACGTVCSTNNITRSCMGSSCSAGVCAVGFGDCNFDKQIDGCETPTTGDVLNCGGCGTVCSTNNITRACVASSCSSGVCTAGFGDCNLNKQTDGCETPTTADVLNCGGCGVVCSTSNITRSCMASSCNAGVCTAGFDDCNTNKQSDGCEINLTNNVLHCGGCGVICSTNHIARSCMASSCNAGSCNVGFDDCNTDKQSDGCETDITAPANCGTCGNNCAGNNNGNKCVTGNCGCVAWATDCNATNSNLCTAGACKCGVNPPCGGGTPTCTAGVCG